LGRRAAHNRSATIERVDARCGERRYCSSAAKLQGIERLLGVKPWQPFGRCKKTSIHRGIGTVTATSMGVRLLYGLYFIENLQSFIHLKIHPASPERGCVLLLNA
jgi:hypothetical protein